MSLLLKRALFSIITLCVEELVKRYGTATVEEVFLVLYDRFRDQLEASQTKHKVIPILLKYLPDLLD